jgi:hypothetical protein
MAFTTCTVPGFVYLLGETVPAWVVAVSIGATAIAFAPLAIRVVTGRDTSATATATDETVPEPVLVHS